MKHILQGSLIVFCLLSTLPCFGERRCSQTHASNYLVKATSLKWLTYQEAIEQSEKDKKTIALFFTGSDWCIWCKKMEDQILRSPEFIQFASQNLYMVKIDFPQSKQQSESVKQENQFLKNKYQVRGFPTLVFIDSQGNEQAQMGFEYGGGENFVNKIKMKLNKK
ncbi:Disulfide bond reductase DsbH [Chlamydia avium]|uniref:Thioredoxin family protein n=1 Tax=Chlamydia avium TaxID=1457141 RepID=A0ABN0MSS3_9CHLA|nr:disulfide reductase DsbH [Chlamydia avium]EPP37005.1 thioredoxin family protein [Chlamydia psittaci 10_743_SC13]EPP38549.1 thioredoxin family protein [Chlamydia avium]VVT43066.1 Disulfide bond reductase DsbH [Chlamydia avium]